MNNKPFAPNDRVITVAYPFEEFTYVSDDGKVAELTSDAGNIHYRRLDTLDRTTGTQSILVGTVRSVIFPKVRRS